jgi:hypothetical protein
MHNVRNNSGVIVGGDVKDSTITVGPTGPAGASTDEAEVLRRLDKLVAELLAGLGQLPTERAGEAASGAVVLKREVSLSDRNPERIRGVLRSLMKAVGTVAPLLELVKEIADPATTLR